MILSRLHRFIFVKTTKTAGTSVEVELARHCGPDDIVTPHLPEVEGFRPRNNDQVIDRMRDLYRNDEATSGNWLIQGLDHPQAALLLPHLSASVIRDLFPQEWTSFLTFTIERNPWDKMVSGYHYVRPDQPDPESFTFEDYVPLGLSWLSGAGHWCDEEGNPIVDRVLRYESLQDDLRELLGELGIDHTGEIHARAKAGFRPDGDDYRSYYTDETREVVARSQQGVIDLMGYEF